MKRIPARSFNGTGDSRAVDGAPPKVELLAVRHRADRGRVAEIVVEHPRLLVGHGDDEIGVGIGVQLPDQLSPVFNVERRQTGACGRQEPAGVSQEVQVDGVHHDASGGRELSEDGCDQFGQRPERQQRDVEARLEDKLLDRVDGKLVHGHAELLQVAHVA